MSCAGRRSGSTTWSRRSTKTGYGLTLGIHTRVGGRAERIARALKVGNVYVNRNTIGAIVGSQPFGGMGLSGTGPKAGGPNYLQRFALEQVVSTDTTAAGGNASLVTLEDEAGPEATKSSDCMRRMSMATCCSRGSRRSYRFSRSLLRGGLHRACRASGRTTSTSRGWPAGRW